MVSEHRSTGERKYYLSSLPVDTSVKPLAGAIKARWITVRIVSRRSAWGRRDGDDVICASHDLRFDAGGRCVGNPFSDRIPAGAAARRFPLVGYDTILWLWPGDAGGADRR